MENGDGIIYQATSRLHILRLPSLYIALNEGGSMCPWRECIHNIQRWQPQYVQMRCAWDTMPSPLSMSGLNCLGAVTLVDTFERHVHISLQYRISRLFVEKTSTVISRGFQLKHIPSGEVIRYPFSLCMSHVWQCNHHDVCSPSSLVCASPAVKRGHSLTVHWLAWPRHSRRPPTILKWALPSPDTVGPVLIARIKLRVFLEFTNFWFANLFY